VWLLASSQLISSPLGVGEIVKVTPSSGIVVTVVVIVAVGILVAVGIRVGVKLGVTVAVGVTVAEGVAVWVAVAVAVGGRAAWVSAIAVWICPSEGVGDVQAARKRQAISALIHLTFISAPLV
jgi:hypothetical protein